MNKILLIILLEYYIINLRIYKFYEINFILSSNHFIAYCHSSLTIELNLFKYQSYYYDCCYNNGEIILINEDKFQNIIRAFICNFIYQKYLIAIYIKKLILNLVHFQ